MLGLALPANAGPATGDITVTATDASNGKRIADICAFAGQAAGCSGGSGSVRLTGLPAGPVEVRVSSPEGRFFVGRRTVTVVGGRTVRARLALKPAASIATVVRDAVTDRGVEEACVSPIRRPGGMITPSRGICSDEEGVLHIGPLQAGDYTLFVSPPEDVGDYGAQWVGRAGGTGNQAEAMVIHATIGRVTTIPSIRLDPAGAVSGRLTVRPGGPAATHGWVGITAFEPTLGRAFGVEADADGRYTLGGLGPYRWPLYLEAAGKPSQWSGTAPNRTKATPVQVGLGTTTRFDAVLVDGATVTGRTTATGAIVAREVGTGDVVGTAVATNGRYTMRVLGRQTVRIDFGNGHLTGPVDIPRTGMKTVNEP
jgi:hypothetical protein